MQRALKGLRSPLVVIGDRAGGLIAAMEVSFPRAPRQRCAIHRARHILAKVSAKDQAEVRAADRQALDGIEAEPGEAAIAVARARAKEFSLRYGRACSAAGRCLEEDFASVATHLRRPRERWRRTGHTNFIKRTFGETRRRVKVIGRLPGERSCVSLVWAVLDHASRGRRGVTQTPAGLGLLQDLRRQLFAPPLTIDDQEAVQAAQDRPKSPRPSSNSHEGWDATGHVLADLIAFPARATSDTSVSPPVTRLHRS